MITFVSADGMPLPPKRRWLRSWLVEVAAQHEARIEHLSYAFGSSAWMANLNQEFLNHEGDTDILTFDYSENPEDGIIHGECCISPNMIREQAKVWGVSFEDEMHRVLVHGLLHLLGYDDQTDQDKRTMRRLEEEALSIRPGIKA
jgi:rRNA maturation RNase YbeY